MQLHETKAPTDRPLDYVDLGLGSGEAHDKRLIGNVGGRRILELGCGNGHAAVGLAKRGARVTAIDSDVSQLSAARELAIKEGVTVEFHQTNLAELAFMTAEQIDLAISVTSLSYVEDLNRVIRQVHRVIKVGGHLLISVPHPAVLCADPNDSTTTVHSWLTTEPIDNRYIHRVEELVSFMCRAKFVIENILEVHTEEGLTPTTLIVRAKKA